MVSQDAWAISWLNVVLALACFLGITQLRSDRVLSPVGVSFLVLLSIFGARPLLMIDSSDYDFHGLDTASGYVYSSTVGIVSIVALAAGYFLAQVLRQRRPPKTGFSSLHIEHIETVALPSIQVATVFAGGVTLLWLVLMAAVGGGPSFLLTLYEGRSESVTSALAGVPVALGAVPLVGAIVLSYTRLRQESCGKLSGVEKLVYWAGIALATLPPLALGTRRYLLPAVIAGAVAALASRGSRKVSLRSIVVAAAIFLVLATVPYTRSAGARQNDAGPVAATFDYLSSEGVGEIVRSVFVSFDTEMYNYIAYVGPKLGNTINYGMGQGTVVELFVSPLPAAWGIPPYSDVLLKQIYGRSCGEGVCPVASLPGTLTFDGGLFAVGVGMVLFGVICSFAEVALRTRRHTNAALASLAFASFTVVLVRGNPVTSLTIMIYALLFSWASWRLLIAFSKRSGSGALTPEDVVREVV